MEFGVQVWDMGAPGSGNGIDSMVTVAQRAESLGFDAVWVNDHVITPVSQKKSAYPIGGAPWPLPPDADVFDPLVVMALLAASTERITIGSSTLVVPIRAALATAKSLVTIDHLSHGRLILGFAPGWWVEEFEALDLPFNKRGKMLDEYLTVFEMACEGGILEFHGEFMDFADVGFYPGAYQRPRFPMVSCGTSTKALERGARYDGVFRILTPLEEVAGLVEELRTRAELAGNDPDRVKLYDFTAIILTDGPATFEGVAALPLAGPADLLIERLHAFEKAGMHQLVTGFTNDPFGPMDEQLEKMQQFAEEVLVPFRSGS